MDNDAVDHVMAQRSPGGIVVEARAVLIATIVAVITLVLLLATVASDQTHLVLPGQDCNNDSASSPLRWLPGYDSADDGDNPEGSRCPTS